MAGMPGNFIAGAYAATIPFFYFAVILILTLLLSPLYFLRPVRYLVILPLVCLDFYLLLDLFIFNVYRFHLDAVFIYILLTDFFGVGVPVHIIILLSLSMAGIVAGNAYLLRRSKAIGNWPVKIMWAALAIYAAGQFIHIWGAYYRQSAIMRYTTDFPYYYPIKATNFMKNVSSVVPFIVPAAEKGDLSIASMADDDALSLRYPLKKIECAPAGGKRPNVLFFLLESWRSDMMTPDITPVISQFARKGTVFTNHLSGGTVTPQGLFSLMFGLHPTYMKYTDADPERYHPVFLNVLKQNGYAMSVFTSSNLKSFSMKEMFFGGMPVEKYVVHYGSDNSVNDRLVVSELVASLKERPRTTPFFTFVFLTASHHGYNFPADGEVFSPVSKESAFLFNKKADPTPLLNRYKNALHYDDALFGEVLDALRKTGFDKNTIIVISSDHGEEFNDKGRGYWGHGSNFTRYQTSVPLVISFPGDPGGQVVNTRSAHIDVVPTLMNRMFSCANDIQDYSSGADLFRLPPKRGIIVRSYVNKACVIDDTAYVDSLPLKRYHLDDVDRKSTEFDYKAIEAMKVSESRFVRRNP
jgi:membrane-anchored protein YejM (alkaline phosphatase superfamily)